MKQDNLCPTCNLPWSFVRCKVTKQGFTECLACAIHREKTETAERKV